MKLLLDTHILLWFLAGDLRLSKSSKDSIEKAANQCYISDASLWEISIKQSLGKLKLAEPFDVKLTEALLQNTIETLPIAKSHIFKVSQLPWHHRDPFDRLLLAASMIEDMPIVTNDPAYLHYDVKVIQ